ncbi:hypothetical protein [Actinomadura miaoliensis]|uniref:DUF2568 domain-containing protein n=1 Tax=Actinomadura miaoliensis TaxID=430685 RepID=A0ABP7WSM9_9ACTN
MRFQRSARAGAHQSVQVPATVNWALAGIAVLLVGHVFAWLYPPQGLTDVFHLVWGLAYAWLALLLRQPRPWARNWLTGLMAVQLVGRLVVFAHDDRMLLRTLVVIGWVVTLAVLALLWSAPSRRYFASRQG